MVNSSDTEVVEYPHRRGGHCGSGAMRDLLEWAGLGWEGPPDEGLVFALRGALDLSYVEDAALLPPVYLVGRGGGLEEDPPMRLGAGVPGHSAVSPKRGGGGGGEARRRGPPA